MPHYEVAIAELDEKLAEIEQHERVITVLPAGDGAVRVITEPAAQKRQAPGEKETRA